jgi:hypothetical protein
MLPEALTRERTEITQARLLWARPNAPRNLTVEHAALGFVPARFCRDDAATSSIPPVGATPAIDYGSRRTGQAITRWGGKVTLVMPALLTAIVAHPARR